MIFLVESVSCMFNSVAKNFKFSLFQDAHAVPVKFTNARLVGGSSANQGTVEVLTPVGWFAVCSTYWGSRESVVLCRQLGYYGVAGLNLKISLLHFLNSKQPGIIFDNWYTI